MPKNSNIVIIRHAEKPETGCTLSVEGELRARAYTVYFQNYKMGKKPIHFSHLIATGDSHESHRPRLTIKPLSHELGIPIVSNYKNLEYKELANELNTNSIYDESNILICWHHGEAFHLAKELGLKHHHLPSGSLVPEAWPDEVFGWNIELSFNEKGELVHENVKCHNQQLMFRDHGHDPHHYCNK